MPAIISSIAQYFFNHLELNNGICIGTHACIHEEINDVTQSTLRFVQEVLTFSIAIESAGECYFGIFRWENITIVLNGE